MAICAPLRRAHSPPVPRTGEPCSLSFHLQKSVFAGRLAYAPHIYAHALLQVGREHRRVNGFPAKSAAPPPGTRTAARPMRTVTRPIRAATHAPSHTHTRTRGRQRPPRLSAGCRAAFRAISGRTEGIVRSTFLARSPVGERGFLRRKKPIFRDVAILLFHYTLFF